MFRDAVLLIDILGRPNKLGDFCTSSMQDEDGTGRFSLSGVVNVISGGRERWIGLRSGPGWGVRLCGIGVAWA